MLRHFHGWQKGLLRKCSFFVTNTQTHKHCIIIYISSLTSTTWHLGVRQAESPWPSTERSCSREDRGWRACVCARTFLRLDIHLQPLWRTTKRSGLTKEWTKATWRETLGSRRRWIASSTLPSPRETSTSWRPSTPSSSWPGWRGREVPRRSGRPPWSPGTSSPSPLPPAPYERCTPWCCSREGRGCPSRSSASWSWSWRGRQSSQPPHSLRWSPCTDVSAGIIFYHQLGVDKLSPCVLKICNIMSFY